MLAPSVESSGYFSLLCLANTPDYSTAGLAYAADAITRNMRSIVFMAHEESAFVMNGGNILRRSKNGQSLMVIMIASR